MTRYHWRIVVTAGMGFFTDAYDLFVIGVVTAILGPIWHLSIAQMSLLNSAALVAAAIGAVVFGHLSDRLGRKKLYGLEVAILFFGALLSASAHSFTMLLVARVIVGFGIGGDYPSSAVVASEHSSASNRGFLVLLVFAMQALGLIVGPLLASLFLSMHVPHEIVWRMLLGFGAIPAASVFYLRRTIKESSHYARTEEVPVQVSRVVTDLSGVELDSNGKRYKKHKLLDRKWFLYMLGTAGSWFLMDIALYGNGISNTLILRLLDPGSSLLSHTLLGGMIFLIFAVPGYALAAKHVDRIGRRKLQFLGFTMITLLYGLIGLWPTATAVVPLFVLIYGLSFFFINFGPNATTFLIPSEIYPASIRAKAHGISASIGKAGAFLGAFFLPMVLHAHGLRYVMTAMAAVSVLGLFTTMLLPEMKQRDLSETEELY